MIELSGWGRYPRHMSELIEPFRPDQVAGMMDGRSGLVARGNGRAYGDAAIGERTTVSTLRLDRMRNFDPATGRLTVEAGALLSDIIDLFLPRGFFPPVVPGTRHVTIGGMIAADVHGKNHHRDGGFGRHVEMLTLALPGGGLAACGPGDALFEATVGGMGLTGTILDASFRLKCVETGWMRQQTIVAEDLAQALRALRESDGATYSVGWIDCLARGAALGRSLIYVGEHAGREEVARSAPGAGLFPPSRGDISAPKLEMPGWVLARPAVSRFNDLYFRRGAARAGGPRLVYWDPYFFPLDRVRGWNRIYGRTGFLQHQCVIPDDMAASVLPEILDRVSRHGNASFLAVLKRLGDGLGMLSFPLPGYTLALDMPVSKDVFPLLDDIDRLVVEGRGRIYLAKDARQSRATFEAGYPDLPRFRELRRDIGAQGRLASRLSTRLGLDG